MRPRSFRNSDHSSFLFLLILGIIKIPFVSFQGSNGRLRPCGVVWQLPILGMCQGVNVSFSPSGVVNYHLTVISKVGFHDLWILGVIKMMTPFKLFYFRDGGLFWTLIVKLVQIYFSVQGVSKSSTPFKGRCKIPLPLSQTTVANCDGGMNDSVPMVGREALPTYRRILRQ